MPKYQKRLVSLWLSHKRELEKNKEYELSRKFWDRVKQDRINNEYTNNLMGVN